MGTGFPTQGGGGERAQREPRDRVGLRLEGPRPRGAGRRGEPNRARESAVIHCVSGRVFPNGSPGLSLYQATPLFGIHFTTPPYISDSRFVVCSLWAKSLFFLWLSAPPETSRAQLHGRKKKNHSTGEKRWAQQIREKVEPRLSSVSILEADSNFKSIQYCLASERLCPSSSLWQMKPFHC